MQIVFLVLLVVQSVLGLPIAMFDSNQLSIEVFVMSKCPDAYYTEQFLHSVLSTLSRAERDSTSVRLEFITNIDGTCKHGSAECDGNRLLLALQKYAPEVKILDFTKLFNANPTLIGGTLSPSVIAMLDAVGVKGTKLQSIQRSYETAESETLLLESGDYTKSLGVKFSATVRVNDQIIAIRDSDTWKSLTDGLSDSKSSWTNYFKHIINDKHADL